MWCELCEDYHDPLPEPPPSNGLTFFVDLKNGKDLPDHGLSWDKPTTYDAAIRRIEERAEKADRVFLASSSVSH